MEVADYMTVIRFHFGNGGEFCKKYRREIYTYFYEAGALEDLFHGAGRRKKLAVGTGCSLRVENSVRA
jgi:hypothetical protein